jgi:hypothetical protein
MERVCSSEKSVKFYQITQRQVPKDFSFQLPSRVSTLAKETAHSVRNSFISRGVMPQLFAPFAVKFLFRSLSHRPVNCYFNSSFFSFHACMPCFYFFFPFWSCKILVHTNSFIAIYSFSLHLNFLYSLKTYLSTICSFVYLTA